MTYVLNMRNTYVLTNGHLKKKKKNLVVVNQFCVLGLFYYKKLGALFSIEGLRFCVVSCVWVIER